MKDIAFDLQLFASSAAVVGSKNPADLSLPTSEWSFKNFSRAANQTWNVNTVEKRDATRGTRELIVQVETQRDLSLSITMDQWDPINVALACWGETARTMKKDTGCFFYFSKTSTPFFHSSPSEQFSS